MSSKKMVFYSGGQEKSNRDLHAALIDLTQKKRGVKMTYLPYCSDGAGIYFGRFKKRYRPFGASRFNCLPVDAPFSDDDLKRALDSDIIYMAGGNTFYFLSHLKKSGIFSKLKKFSKEGGVIAGLSAGAIMMTPNIEMAGFPPYDPDENDVGLTNLKAMGLVNFEFFPHFVNSKRFNEAMMMYSLISPNPVYACKDGGGIVIDGKKKIFHGDVDMFYHGKKVKI